mmetsp:Transcript_141042/g.351772  ORF Transcript_141042/g.351772 Transcript_141042/m.351772 type:complete len:220 (+) Transcript_141042:173-832(+)
MARHETANALGEVVSAALFTCRAHTPTRAHGRGGPNALSPIECCWRRCDRSWLRWAHRCLDRLSRRTRGAQAMVSCARADCPQQGRASRKRRVASARSASASGGCPPSRRSLDHGCQALAARSHHTRSQLPLSFSFCTLRCLSRGLPNLSTARLRACRRAACGSPLGRNLDPARKARLREPYCDEPPSRTNRSPRPTALGTQDNAPWAAHLRENPSGCG